MIRIRRDTRSRSFALALLVAFSPPALSASAWAQGTMEDPTTVVARARFKEGVDYFDRGEYELARASFLQAYALKKHPAVLLNLAWSSLKSGHALEAERYFRQFLAESKDISEKQRADANEGLAQSHSRLGRVEVLAPAGTEVTIDGERSGMAPLSEPSLVEAGAHTVKFKSPDGAVETQSVTALGGEKVTVRSGRTPGLPLPPAVASAASPPSMPATTSTPLPQEAEAADVPVAADGVTSDAPGHKSLWSAPNNVGPAVFLGSLAIAGTVTAIVFYLVKSSAQDKADQVASQIAANAPNGNTMGICTNPTAKFAAACAALATDTNDVNSDATAGNVTLAIGLTAAAGAIVYWIAADKSEPARKAGRPVLAPALAPSFGGLSLSGTF
ncbi:MAG: tetratricopeptide repeat protein [Myxococcota bacterium]|nr:tetratricopeptide repeat protein [Myxococcota bacterium]